MSGEEWRPVVGYEGRYSVSSRGQVYSHLSGRIRRVNTNRGGYRQVKLSGADGNQTLSVHRVVADAFLGARPDGLMIRHLDGDKTNNAVENLAYGTAEENWADRRRLGEYTPAETCSRGHSLADSYSPPGRPGFQVCRKCRYLHHKAYRARRRAALKAVAS